MSWTRQWLQEWSIFPNVLLDSLHICLQYIMKQMWDFLLLRRVQQFHQLAESFWAFPNIPFSGEKNCACLIMSFDPPKLPFFRDGLKKSLSVVRKQPSSQTKFGCLILLFEEQKSVPSCPLDSNISWPNSSKNGEVWRKGVIFLNQTITFFFLRELEVKDDPKIVLPTQISYPTDVSSSGLILKLALTKFINSKKES